MAFIPEVAEEASFGVAELAVLMALLGLLMLRFIWAGTFGALLQRIASTLGFLHHISLPFGGPGLGGIPDAFTNLDHFVYNAIGQGIAATEYAWHRLLLWNAYILIKTGEEIANVAHDTWQALDRLYHHLTNTVPTVIEHTATSVVHKIVSTVYVRAPALTHKIAAEYETLTARVAKLEHAATHVAARAVAIPFPGLGRIERDLEAEAARLKKLGWAGVYTGVAALGVAILARLGLGWTRCSNVGKFGKNICGMDARILDALLLGTTAIAGTVSLVEFAKVMLTTEEEIVKGLQVGIRELRGVKPLKFSGYTGTLG